MDKGDKKHPKNIQIKNPIYQTETVSLAEQVPDSSYKYFKMPQTTKNVGALPKIPSQKILVGDLEIGQSVLKYEVPEEYGPTGGGHQIYGGSGVATSVQGSQGSLLKSNSTKDIGNMRSLQDYMSQRFPQIQPINQKHQLPQQIPKIAQIRNQQRSVRENYGEFYKNLIKPGGGKVLERLQQDKTTNNFSVFDPTTGLDVKLDPIQQMNQAKDSFQKMIGILSSNSLSPQKLKPNRGVSNQSLPIKEDITNIVSPDSLELTKTTAIQQVESQLMLPNMDKSLSTKNLSFEKPSVIYKNYLKEQRQKSITNLQNSLNSSVLMKEKITITNHLRAFDEDSHLLDDLHKSQSTFNNQSKFKKNSLSQSTKKRDSQNNNETINLKAFKDLEQEFGRGDIQTFEKIIKDLLQGQVFIEDLIPKEELDKVMGSKFYAGFSLAPEVKNSIKNGLHDEYDIDINELDDLLKDQHFTSKVNHSYQRHLKSYNEDLKLLKKIHQKLEKDDFGSVVEEYKLYKIQQRLEKDDIFSNPTSPKNDKIFIDNYGEIKDQNQIEKEKSNSKYQAFILYMALQEMIKQVFVECRDKGRLFLRIFRKYFEEMEKNWYELLKKLIEHIKVLKSDRSFLLNKFINKKNKDIDNTFIKDQLQQILENREVSEENLIEHKRLVTEMIGFINREEDERYLMELEKKNFEKDVKDIIYQWDLVRANLDFKEKIRKVNSEKIKEEFMLMDEIRANMKKDDLAVLINLERIRTALSNNQVKWDLDKLQLEGQNAYYKEENTVIKAEMKKLREQQEINQDLLQERSKEIFDLTQRLKKFTSRLDIIEKSHMEAQTDVSFKNEHFTSTLDQILANKLNNQLKKITKLMNKASANVNRYQPMSRQEMLDLMQGIYIKKSQEINTKNEIHIDFDDFVYSVLIQRFGTKKKANHKGQEFMLALKKYAKEDERVDCFKHFLGFDEAHTYNREVLEFYIKVMKSTNESVQNLMSVPAEGESQTPCEKIYIEFQSAYDRYIQIFSNSSKNLKEELKKHLIFESELIIDGEQKIEIKLNEKWELYAMLMFSKHLFKENSTTSNIEEILVEKLRIDAESNIQCSVPLQQFKNLFLNYIGVDDSRIVFQVIDETEFFDKYFSPLIFHQVTEHEDGTKSEQQCIKVRGMKKLFREKYDFKITVRKYMELGLKMSIRFLEEAKEYYGKIFKVFDADGDGFITFSEFRKIIKKVDPTRADWKIHAIFKKSTNVEDSEKGQLKFNEFIKCSMNNMLMEGMIDWDKVLLEEKEEKAQKHLQLMAEKTNSKTKTIVVKNKYSSGSLSPYGSGSRTNSQHKKSTFNVFARGSEININNP